MKSWKEIEGYLHELEGEMLNCLAYGRECLEIGSFYGRSSVCIAESAKSLLCVDTFEADSSGQKQTGRIATLQGFKENIKGYSNIEFRVMTSKDFFQKLDPHIEFGLIFVDGFHKYSAVKHDIEQSWKHLYLGGVLVLHDYDIGCGVPLAAEHCNLVPMDGQIGDLAWKVKRC